MWAGCQGVDPVRSAQIGTDTSARIMTANPRPRDPTGTRSSRSHPTMHTLIPAA